MNSAAANRFDGIDMLRGISIVAVVIHHINIHLGGNHSPLAQALPRQIAATLFWNGANGVTVFFAISGFLITTMSLRRWGTLGQIRVADFYRLRFARIVPLLVALLVVLSILHLSGVSGYVIKAHTRLPRALLAAGTFHINWLESQRGYLPGNWDVLWSLSVEEVFYLFFPLLCVFTRRLKVLVPLLVCFVIIGPFARTMTHNPLWADYGYLSCTDAIALGCIAAIFAVRIRLGSAVLMAFRTAGVILVLLVMTARPLVHAMHIYQFGLDVTCLALGTCLLQIAIAQHNRAGGWMSAPMRAFGRNSYEVYLTHMFVVTWGIQIFVASRLGFAWHPASYLTMLVSAGFLGATVARWYSEPLNRRLRRSLTNKASSVSMATEQAAAG